MCVFSGPVHSVGGTTIFARFVAPGRQALVYSMNLENDTETAMILPIPVVPGSGDDAVQFVDLSAYASFFGDLNRAFYPPGPVARGIQALSAEAPTSILVVHDVGAFEASYVPSPADFIRLDPRFRLDDAVWKALPDYADYGFTVFKLKPKTSGGFLGFGRKVERQTIHPMAFTFPSRSPETLFFPTVHVHDGEVHARAGFDHSLYCQVDGRPTADAKMTATDWIASEQKVGQVMDPARAAGLIAVDDLAWRLEITGQAPNRDVWA